MTSSAILGFAFLLLGLSAGTLMLRLWLYPYDEVNHVSSAPKSLLLLHRLMGYAFVAVYIVLMTRMVPRLWEYSHFAPRTIVHAALGIAIGCVLVLKVTILRFLPDYRKYLRILGSTIMLMTVGMLAVPLLTASEEQRLSARIADPVVQAFVRDSFAAMPDVGAVGAAKLGEESLLRAGRAAFLVSCMQCHEIRHTLSKPRTAAGWTRLVGGMAKRAAKSDRAEDIPADQHQMIAAYLTAINGVPNPPAPVAEETTKAAAPVDTTAPVARPISSSEQAPSDEPATALADASFAVMRILETGTCLECHTPPTSPENLDLDTLEGLLRGGDNGPVVIAGNPNASELVKRLRGESLPRMPLDGEPLSDADINIVADWIANLGKAPATSPATTQSAPTTTSTAPAAATPTPTPRATLAPPALGEPVRYSHIRPFLIQSCIRCHATEGKMGPAPEGLVLTSWASIFAPRERPIVIPGNPDASSLIRHVRGTESPRMPFDGPPYLTAEQQTLLERWVRDGARDENGNAAPIPVGEEIRLRGTLTSQWVVDGVPFLVNGGTEIRDAQIGATVEVRAKIGAEGGLVAERVRGR